MERVYYIYIYTLEIFISRMGLNSQFYFSNFGSYYYYLYQNNVSFYSRNTKYQKSNTRMKKKREIKQQQQEVKQEEVQQQRCLKKKRASLSTEH